MRRPRTLAQLRADPKVESAERKGPGEATFGEDCTKRWHWLCLADGWHHNGVIGIHELTVSSLYQALEDTYQTRGLP